MTDLPPPTAPDKPEPAAKKKILGIRTTVWLVLVGLIVIGAIINRAVGDDDEPDRMTPSEAFCSDVQMGANPMNLPEGFAGDAYGMMAISCPDELEGWRDYFENQGIDIDA